MGFIGMLRKIIKLIAPSHVLVVFDPEEIPARSALNAQYKKNRKDLTGVPDRENPFSQIAGIYQALQVLGIRFIEEPGYEADDMIASYAIRADGRIIIVSSDSDFFPLINDNIVVLHYRGKKSIIFDPEMVEARFGLHPSSFLEFKALTGDKSDNIRGIKGVGPKTALKILGGLRRLSLEEEIIFTENENILRLHTDVSLPVPLDQLILDKRILDMKAGGLFAVLGLL
jgi:DNA polymerase-1